MVGFAKPYDIKTGKTDFQEVMLDEVDSHLKTKQNKIKNKTKVAMCALLAQSINTVNIVWDLQI